MVSMEADAKCARISSTRSNTIRFRFTKKERDIETGLDYFGARYYMPAVGRWASVDPLLHEKQAKDLLKIRGGQLFAVSPYNYTFNSPATLTDPDGKCAECLLDLIR